MQNEALSKLWRKHSKNTPETNILLFSTNSKKTVWRGAEGGLEVFGATDVNFIPHNVFKMVSCNFSVAKLPVKLSKFYQ